MKIGQLSAHASEQRPRRDDLAQAMLPMPRPNRPAMIAAEQRQEYDEE